MQTCSYSSSTHYAAIVGITAQTASIKKWHFLVATAAVAILSAEVALNDMEASAPMVSYAAFSMLGRDPELLGASGYPIRAHIALWSGCAGEIPLSETRP